METTRLAREPSQQGFGEGSGLAGLRAQKSRKPEYSRCSTRQRTWDVQGSPDDASGRSLIEAALGAPQGSARIQQPDEPVALTNQEVHNPTGHERAPQNDRPRQCARPLWRAPARPGVEMVSAHVRTEHRGRTSVLPRHAHDVYQRGSERRRRESPPPKRPACSGFGRASLTVRPRPPS